MKTFNLIHKQWLGIIGFALLITLGLTGCWNASIPIPHPVSLYAYAQCVGDINSFYVIGGADEWDQPLDYFLRFDASQGIWYRLAPMPTPSMASAASCYQGRIYVVTPEQNLYIYDIVSETWSYGSPPPRTAWGAAIGVWDGKLYLVGGSPDEWGIPTDEINVYNLISDNWITSYQSVLPVAASLPGYVQAGPFLYLAGGFGTQSPTQNVDATQRYDMSSNTWELGPTFNSARAAFSLSIHGYRLFAVGGDANGGTFLDETADIESLDLNVWNGGDWGGDSPALPQGRMFTAGGYCTEAVVGGEIWSVGGALPDEVNLNALTEILYRDPYYRQDANHPIWQEAMRIPPELLSEATNSTGSLDYLQGQQGVATNGNCYTGEFDLSIGAISPEGAGLPGEIVTYTLMLTNTGDIPDVWDIVISSGWQTEISFQKPVWPNMSEHLVVTVTIPADAEPYEQDISTITFTSQGDQSVVASIDLVTLRLTGAELIPTESTGSGTLGATVSYPVSLLNATGQTDSFDLELGSHDWDTNLSSDQIGPIPVGEVGTFTVSVNIPGDVPWYSQDEVVVTALSHADPGQYSDTSQITTTAYAPPDLSYTPEKLESIQIPDQVVTQTLTISNGIGVTLTFNAVSLPGIEDLLVFLPLDEPEGSINFHDASENGNNGFCSGATCPATGVIGRFGRAVSFDGVDDFIQLPAFSSGGAMSIGAWVYSRDIHVNNARVMDFSNGPGADNILIAWLETTGRMRWGIRQGGVELPVDTAEVFPENEWVHVVAVVDENGTGFIYWNGNLVESTQVHTPYEMIRNNQYIALSAWNGDAYFNGMIDDFFVSDHALSSEEVMALYVGRNFTDWLSVTPKSGTVQTGSSIPIQVTFDAYSLQPDTYTSTLYISSNDPLIPLVQVPVTMTVEPTPSMGWVEGIVSDLRTGEPLEATIVAEGQPYTLTSDAETGYYKLWLEAGLYHLEITAPGFVLQSIPVAINVGQGITQDIALLQDAPWLEYSPESLDVNLFVGGVTTQEMTLTNIGFTDLDFEFIEFDDLRIISDSSWRVSGTYIPGWEATDFNDSVWEYTVAPAPVNCGTLHCWDDPDVFTMWSEIQYTTIYIRKSFNIPSYTILDAASVISATITTDCDDDQDVYINGTLVASDWNGYAGPTLVTEIGPYLQSGKNVIGVKANDTAGGCRVMCVDSRIHLSAPFPSWLAVEPKYGTIPASTSTSIRITIIATNLQPGVYNTILYVGSNDPLTPVVEVPVTLTVEPTSNMGWVEGYITDLRTGEPLEATIIAEGQPYTVTSDTETGYYKLWLEVGTYNLHASALGYVEQSAPVTIITHRRTRQDFTLLPDAPWLQISPKDLSVTQLAGEVTTHTLTLSNTGSMPLDFQMFEGGPSADVLLLHLDDPAGSTTFFDTSGAGNHGFCSVGACPQAGVTGIYGTAVQFDGSNDTIAVQHSPSFDLIEDRDTLSVAAWVNINGWYYGWFPIVDKHEASTDFGWIFEVNSGGYFRLAIDPLPAAVCSFQPDLGEWYHLAVTYDRSTGGIQFYINGTLACDFEFSQPIPDTEGEPLYIGYSPSGGDEYANGTIDEILIFDYALSLEEIQTIYSSGPYFDVPWMVVDSISGTIPSYSSLPAQVILDASIQQPGYYSTSLYVQNNDLLNPMVQIPITMTVEPTPSMGWVEGIVTDLRTGEPVEAMIIADNQRYTVTTDPLTGYYKIWMETISYSDYHTLEVNADGYITQTIQLVIHPQQGLTQDFALMLDAPWLEYSPDGFTVTQMLGEVTTQTLTLSNTGTIPLEFNIGERITNSVLILHLDEPASATTFYDSSGYDNNASCTGDSCPNTGEGGMIGNAVDFDGLNDYLSIPHSPEFDAIENYDRVTISSWINIYDWNATVFPIINVYEADNDYGWAYEVNNSGIYLWVPDGAVSCSFIPSLNEWYHLVFTYDRGLNTVTFYVNGTIACQTSFSEDIPDTSGDPIYIGWSKAGPDEFSNGMIDEVIVYDRALTSDEILKIYIYGVVNYADWISIDPISGTIPSNASLPIQVTLDSTTLQPDIYTNTLYITNNDPLTPLVQMPITLTVELPTSAGLLAGTITSLDYCDIAPAVLPWADLLIKSSMGVTWTVSADEDGVYSYWLDEAGNPYTVTVITDGYDEVYATGVVIVGQQTTTKDFAVRWLMPCLDTVPEHLPMTLQMGMSDTLPLVITNTGAAPAMFELIERDSGQIIPIQGEAIELTIPSGPEVAPVGSAVAAGPYTPRQETTYRIQAQVIQVNPPKVLLLNADDGDGQWIRDQLLGYGDLAGVDSFNARIDTPTLTELVAYDVILTWSNYPYAFPEGIGDVLADYVDTGGYVINLMYALGEHGWEMEGRFMNEAYNAIQGGLVKYDTSCLGDHHPTHFIFLGVDEVCEFYRLSDTSLTPGSAAIARWQDGEVFVASNQDRSVISITGYVGYYYRWTGQMDRVIHNAILWFILGDDIPWLETEPISGTVSADGGIVNTNVIFNTTGYQPNEFAADLLLFSNDPVRSPIQVSVSLNIIPTPTMGYVEGIVTDLRTGEPLQATIIAEGQPYTVTSDLENGYYKMWLEHGVYTLTASAPGYVTQAFEIDIAMQAGTTQDFALLLDAAWLGYAPESFTVTQLVGQVTTQTLTLSNTGTVPLGFSIGEGITSSVLILHLDEPAGATYFSDTSGYGNNASCIGNSCPIAGVDGWIGYSLDFDGVNDYLSIPHSPQFDIIEEQDKLTYATWINIQDWPSGYFPLLDVYRADQDYGWGIEMDQSNIYLFSYQGYGPICSHNLQMNTWNHVAITYDRQLGVMSYYINGVVLCTSGLTIDIPDIISDPIYIGLSKSGADEYSAGLFDEVLVFDRALTDDEILMLYEGESSQVVDWLRIDPISGIVPINDSIPVQVTFDASGLLPETYTTTLFLTSNDPLLTLAAIPITMTVSGEVTPTTVTLSGAEQGWVDKTYTFTATVSPETALTPLTYVWQVDEQAPVTHIGGITDTVSYTWDTLGAKVISVTTSNAYGEVMDTHLITILELPYHYYLPLLHKEEPAGGSSGFGGMEVSWLPAGTIGILPLIPLYMLRKRRD